MLQFLKGAFGGRPAVKAAKAMTRQARPQVESLDERVLLTASVPNLVGTSMGLDNAPYYMSARTLTFTAEHDNGNGTGTFTALFKDTDGSAYVNGTIKFNADLTTYHGGGGDFGWSGGTPSMYDFSLRYSGLGASKFGGYDSIAGSGEFQTTYVSGAAGWYTYSSPHPSWWYSGQSVEVATTSWGPAYTLYHTDTCQEFYTPM
jgi:hypothetical protein